jgi:hypothetical protein
VVWGAQRDELFTNLLFAIAKDVRYQSEALSKGTLNVTVKREKPAA